MSVRLLRITWAEKTGIMQHWFPTHAKAMSHIRIQQEVEPSFAVVIEEFSMPTGGIQLSRWLNEHCDRAQRVTPGPESKAA